MNHIAELRVLLLEVEIDGVDRAVAVLGDDDFCLVLVLGVLVVIVLAVEKHDDVGVLLKGAGLAQVGEHRPLDLARFDGARELRERDDRHVELARERLQGTRDLGDLLLAVVAVLVRPALHELQVVDDDEVEAVLRLEAARLRAQVHDRDARRVVDVNRRAVELVGDGDELRPVRVVELARAQELRVDAAFGAEHALHKLLLAHLE